MHDGSFGIELERIEYRYSQYEGLEYEDFVLRTGGEVDIPYTDLLIKPTSVTLLITTPGQWALLLMMVEEDGKMLTRFLQAEDTSLQTRAIRARVPGSKRSLSA